MFGVACGHRGKGRGVGVDGVIGRCCVRVVVVVVVGSVDRGVDGET